MPEELLVPISRATDCNLASALSVEFLKFIRGEKKFKGIDELRSKYMPFTIARTIGFDCKNHTSLDTYTADNRIPLQNGKYGK